MKLLKYVLIGVAVFCINNVYANPPYNDDYSSSNNDANYQQQQPTVTNLPLVNRTAGEMLGFGATNSKMEEIRQDQHQAYVNRIIDYLIKSPRAFYALTSIQRLDLVTDGVPIGEIEAYHESKKKKRRKK